MVCPQCQFSNPPGATRCTRCSNPIAVETPTIYEPVEQSAPPEAQAAAASGQASSAWSRVTIPGVPSSSPDIQGPLGPGTLLAERYEILQELGEGGMGTVYKAQDRELDRVVALKVIRPDLARQADILKRFKQELILSRQVTHRNVVRIFDLGVAGSIKFITMEYLDGRDLKTILVREKFTPQKAAEIICQVCRGLEAAHAENVIHRDLKPQNIMLDTQGRVSVMDFGLAHSLEERGMTRTGALMGTPDYMSPEQAQGQKADARSDIFSLGIIFYEMLTGKLPFHAESLLGTLLARTQQRAKPVREVDPQIPQPLNDIVAKCLATEADKRYQSATELLADLETFLGTRAPSTISYPGITRPGQVAISWKWLAAGGLAIIALLIAGFLFRDRIFPSKPPAKPNTVAVLVADFDNNTGDPIFDNTIEPMFTLAMEGASFISAYNHGQARRLLSQVKPGATRLDESAARLIAQREGVTVVITGSISRSGSGYAIEVKASDAITAKMIATKKTETGSKEGVLTLVGKLAAPIRNALGDATPESAQLAAAETVTASSLEAAHDYSLGQDHMWEGKLAEAAQDYSKAVELDPKFGRAYAGLAISYLNRKRYAEAGEYYKKALALLDRMSERERYRTLGTYYLSYVQNYGQAAETLKKLVSLYPADTAGYNNLGIAYAFVRNLPEAATAAKRALEIAPNNVQTRLNYAEYSMLAGNFPEAISETQRILKQNPAYEFAFLPLALSTLAQGDVKGARDVYDRLGKLSPQGLSLSKAGQADLEMFLGRYKEALEPLQTGIAADDKEKNAGELAAKYIEKADAHLGMGQRSLAIESAHKGAELAPVESILYLAARVVIQAGDDAQARAIAAKLENMLQNQTKSDALLIAGEISLNHKRFTEAVETLQSAQKLQDLWVSHFLLGRTYVEAGHFAEALAEFEICRKRKGEAADFFLADMPTLRYLPPLYFWLGRAQEGLGTTEASRASYQEFLRLRADADASDSLAVDARRRVGAVQ